MSIQTYVARRSLTVCIAACTYPALLGAQGTSSSELETIVVEATRISRPLQQVPGAVSVVGQEDIQLGRQQLGLDEALTRVPGLFMQNRYNFAQDLRISIRGFGARAAFGIRGIKILVDGIPETLPDGTARSTASTSAPRAASRSFADPARRCTATPPGGSSASPLRTELAVPYLSARLSAGAYDFQKFQVKAGGQAERVNYFLSLSDTEVAGYRAHSEAENTQFTGRFGFDLGNDRSLLAVVNTADQPLSNDPGGVNAAAAAADPSAARGRNVAYDTGEALNQDRIGFVYSTPVGDGGELAARSYFVWRDFSNKLPQFPRADGVNLERFFAGGGVTYTHTGMLGGLPNRLIVGFDTDDQGDVRRRFRNNLGTLGALLFHQDEDFVSRGVFVQDELTLSEQLQLTFGLRYDQVEYTVTDHFLADGDDSGNRALNDVSPLLGLLYALSPSVSLYATVSTAFETPSTTDFANPSGGGGFNPALDPQQATNYELGLRGTVGERHYYELAVFDIDVDDEIVPFDVDGRTFFQNAGASNRTGIEATWVTNPTDRIRASIAYSYGNFEFDEFQILSLDAMGVPAVDRDFSGNVIPGTVKHLLFGEVSYTHPSGWYGAFDVLHVGEQFANNANSVAVDAYTVGNLRLGLERALGSTVVSPFVGINNLFDERYNANIRINAFGGRYFEPAPDRNVYAGVTVRFDFR